jgi:hypothetical protein
MMFMLTWVIMLLYKMRYVMTFLCARVIMLFYMNVYTVKPVLCDLPREQWNMVT